MLRFASFVVAVVLLALCVPIAASAADLGESVCYVVPEGGKYAGQHRAAVVVKAIDATHANLLVFKAELQPGETADSEQPTFFVYGARECPKKTPGTYHQHGGDAKADAGQNHQLERLSTSTRNCPHGNLECHCGANCVCKNLYGFCGCTSVVDTSIRRVSHSRQCGPDGCRVVRGDGRAAGAVKQAAAAVRGKAANLLKRFFRR